MRRWWTNYDQIRHELGGNAKGEVMHADACSRCDGIGAVRRRPFNLGHENRPVKKDELARRATIGRWNWTLSALLST